MNEKKIDYRILALVICIAVLAVILSYWRNLRKGFFLENDFFYRTEDSLYQRDSVNYIRSMPGGGRTSFIISLDGEEQSASLQRQEDFVSITYDDGTVIEGVWNGQWLLDKETGVPMAFGTDSVTVTVGSQPLQALKAGKLAISSALCRIVWGDLERRGNIALLWVGGILYALGAVSFFFPNEMYFFLRRWAYQNAELSEPGLFMERVGGVIGMVVGAVVMLGLFII